MSPLPKFDDAKQYWLSGKKLNEIIRAIQERTPIAGPGLLAKAVPQGVILSGAGAESTALHPFKLFVTEDGDLTIWPGTVNGVVPTWDSTSLAATTPPSETLGPTAFIGVWLRLSSTLTFADGFLFSADAITAEIETVSGGTTPDEDPAAGVWYINIGYVNDRNVTAQTVMTSLWASICDASTPATETASLDVVRA